MWVGGSRLSSIARRAMDGQLDILHLVHEIIVNEQFATVAETAGYRGAHFTTSDGDHVADWLEAEGVRLLQQPDVDFAYRYKVGDPL